RVRTLTESGLPSRIPPLRALSSRGKDVSFIGRKPREHEVVSVNPSQPTDSPLGETARRRMSQSDEGKRIRHPMFPILEGEFEVKVKVKGQQKKITKITSYNLNNEIEDYLGFSAFATAVWCLNKPINLHSPKSVERRHPNAIKLPESNTALVHFGRFLTHNIGATIKGDTILGEPLKNGERSRPLLHGSKYAEAAINATCMACDRKCSSAGRTGKMKDARLSVLQGVPWCTSCARKHEARTTDY
ncbi:unnamed protein product, partial [Ectocarpus sp. 12 AP-2014]